MKRIYRTIIFLALLTSISVWAQPKQTIAVLTIDQNGVASDPITLGDIVRLELIKFDTYEVVDRYDMRDLLKDTEVEIESCYSKSCLLAAAEKLNADKMVSGSVQRIGDKILISLKLVDAATGRVERNQIGEFIMQPEEIQNMIKITLNDLLGRKNDELLVSNLRYYSTFQVVPSTKIVNNGPRVGIGYVTGEMGDQLVAPESEGGYNATPYLSQFGYQHELQYMNSGHFQGLVEILGLVSGLDQSMFIPSLIVLNGFRENKFGFEVGFGPSISIRQMARGYVDAENNWQLASEWNPYDENGTLLPEPAMEKRIDSRGNYELHSRWVWSIGKTFRSGYLNIPVNVYISSSKNDVMYGLSVGFNLQRRRLRTADK